MFYKILLVIMLSSILKLFSCKTKADNQAIMPPEKELEKSFQDYLNRPIYKELPREIIESLPDDDLEQSIFDNISIRMEGDNRTALEILKGMTTGQQAIYSTWEVEAEVNNGGFNQFYFNSSKQFSDMAVLGFEIIQAHQFADLMREANKTYVKNKDWLERFDDGTVESFSKSYESNPLNPLDEKFYQFYQTEDLKALKVRYIRMHIEEFIQQ